MNQNNFIAKQDKTLDSISSLMSNLQKLRSIHTDTIQNALTKWQESNIESIQKDNLKIPTYDEWCEYLTDGYQRSILYFDTLRQRGDNILTYQAQGYPLILKFDYEVLIDGHDLPEPCNYSLLEIKPLPGQIINEKLQPIVVVDPRGGHGAGIGGFKEDSEIGESLRAGHPTYFISFTHSPVPGQTLETITKAQVKFIEEVIRRHPDADKPVIIGNCQAGWAIMLLASQNPSLPGALIINGAPLSYWSGIAGQNPMRYAGGLMGGAWVTRFASDFGNGRFDGTWLVSNFENLNPANTFWTKYYNLFSKIDTEPQRFLDFERWWSHPVLYNSNEIEMIVDDLFIGNRLTRPGLCDGNSQLLKRIESPIIVFCSSGDNITPPEQALNWIIDVYPNDIDLRKAGKTIIYLQHKSIGHLGIFVSGTVARREHRQLIASLDAVKALPPGLFEMIIKDIKDSEGNIIDLEVLFELRSIDDLKAQDTDGRVDEKVFPLVNRISETISNLYELFVRPTMQHIMTEPVAQMIRESNPFYQNQIIYSSLNPMSWWLPGAANMVKSSRHPIREENALLTWQELFSKNITNLLDTYRDGRDASQEMTFFSFYGMLNALTGFKDEQSEVDTVNESRAFTQNLETALAHGGIHEASIRILLLLSSEAGTLDRDTLTDLVHHYRQVKSYDSTNDHNSLREMINFQNLLVFSYPTESLHSLGQLLPDIGVRHRLLNIIEKEELSVINRNEGTKKLWIKINDILLGKEITPPPSSSQEVTEKEPAPKPVVNTKGVTKKQISKVTKSKK